ncbi:uncharacterized protein LOC111356720 [Spodoptera litura]|uniref:Uncharacterized protein LOC111356720 n=1 Tax=Spodoptera litura TaxID=69820 RepID=A0A9J7EEC8_SPOLT|nr:uncharacterized protein LOC111356720 [Spodoptera litura]
MVYAEFYSAKMKLFWCCFCAVLATVSGAALDVEKTVKQVQNILQSNQLLPRLTRNEIIQLLNDIRAEDAKSTSTSTSTSTESKENKKETVTTPYSTIENEINPQEPKLNPKVVDGNKNEKVSSPPTTVETTTKKAEPTLMVVLPYTPRDGSSLQELYTRPPRTEVVALPSTTPRPKISQTKQNNAKPNNYLPEKLIDNFPEELQAFLDAHGLEGKPGQDHFLLPLEGFKPLPPPKVVDGTVQLPENILLTYDLIAPSSDSTTKNDGAYSLSPNNFLYEPLRPELPYELDTSSSETKEISLPYDMPVRKTKSVPVPNYEPIDYEAVKVIPLNKGINPINEQVNTNNDQSKRQAEEASTTTTEKVETSSAETTTSTTTEEPKTNAVSDSSVSADDSGASIADLEDSFGGAAPSVPGDSELPPPRKNGFYWMLDWNSFLEVGDGDTKVNIRFEPKLGDPQMFLPVTVP